MLLADVPRGLDISKSSIYNMSVSLSSSSHKKLFSLSKDPSLNDLYPEEMAFCFVILCFECGCCSQVEIIMGGLVYTEIIFSLCDQVCTQLVQSMRDAPY